MSFNTDWEKMAEESEQLWLEKIDAKKVKRFRLRKSLKMFDPSKRNAPMRFLFPQRFPLAQPRVNTLFEYGLLKISFEEQS